MDQNWSQSGPPNTELRWDRDGTVAGARVDLPQKHPTILHSFHSMSYSWTGNMPLCLFSIGLKNKLLSGWNLELEPDSELTHHHHNELRWDRDGTGAKARVEPLQWALLRDQIGARARVDPHKNATTLHSVHSVSHSCRGNNGLCLFSIGLKMNYCQVEIWSCSQIWHLLPPQWAQVRQRQDWSRARVDPPQKHATIYTQFILWVVVAQVTCLSA